jgi:hypothetical protein
MAVVGEAHIIVRAITSNVKSDIEKGFAGADGAVKKSGSSIAKTFRSDFARSAEMARLKLAGLTKTSFGLQAAFGTLASGLSSVVVGLGSIIGAAGGAAASVAALGNAIVALPIGLIASKLALSGVSNAVSQVNSGSGSLGKTIEELREELQQLRFEAEEAALGQEGAALALERAREAYIRSQDLPTNSRERRQAELDFKQADLAYRRAKDRNSDLQKELNNPSQGGGAGGADPFEGLTDSQKQFAKFLAQLKPLLTDLKIAAGDSYLPVLEEQITRLLNLNSDGKGFFLALREGLRDVSVGLGSFVTSLTDLLTSTRGIENIDTLFKNASNTIGSFGRIFSDYLGAFLGILSAATPVTERFLDFLERSAFGFQNFIYLKQANGELQTFLNRAGELAADFGEVFGNVFGFFGDLIASNFGPTSGGQLLLNWLKSATNGMKTLRERVGEVEFDIFMLNASENAKAVLQSIGALVKELGKLGALPQVKETFDILKQGAPALGEMLAAGAKAGPMLARLLVALAEISAVLGDASGIRIFFDTLAGAAETVARILENDVVRFLVLIVGSITAAAIAFGVLKTVVLFFGKAAAGALLLPVNYIKGMPAAFAAAAAAGQTAGFVIKSAFGVLGIIAGVATAVYYLNEEFERTKAEAVTSADAIKTAFLKSGDATDGLDLALQSVNGSVGVVKDKLASFKTVDGKDIISTENLSIAFDDVATKADSVKIALRAMTTETTGLGTTTNNFASGAQGSWTEVETAFKNTGQALATLAAADLPTAIDGFKDLSESYDLNSDEQRYLLESMPDLSAEIKRQAEEAGVAGTDLNVLRIATGELDLEQVKAEKSGEAFADELAAIKKQAEEASREVDTLKDKIFNFGTTTLDTRAAARALESAIDDFSDTVKKNGKTLDLSTEKGRENQAALDAIASSAVDAANANFELSGNTAQLKTDMVAARDAVILAGKELGLTDTAASNLADTLVGSNYDIDVSITALTKAEADRAAKESAATWRESLKNTGLSEYALRTGLGSAVYNATTGQGLGNKDGGFIRKFAPGGFVSGAGTARSDSIPAMLSNGEYVINARATAQNRELLDSINNNENVSMAPVINVTVNPSAGMDEVELASMVSRQIASEVRRGTI